MQRSEFHYEIPEELIAERPCAQRSGSRMLCLGPAAGALADRYFTELPDLLRPGDLLVFNDTRVIPARLLGAKASGGKVEVLVERIMDDHHALAHVRASKAPKPGTRLVLEGALEARVHGRQDDLYELEFAGAKTVAALLEAHGHIPLPPYIKRADVPADRARYQTIYARSPGAVAAPTAGLHFDHDVMARIEARGIDTAFVTLHIGAGTFQPVRAADVNDHVMHHEYYEVGESVCNKIHAVRRRGGRVVAVGTTVVRSLESATPAGGLPVPGRGETDLFITPGYKFRCIDALLTNFHLPESTLLMLVCAFAGYDTVMAAYRHAVSAGYRFYSYGDAMFIQTQDTPGQQVALNAV